MATQQQLQSLEKYVDVIYELLVDQVTGAALTPVRQLSTNRTTFARMLGQLLYEAPKIFTGLASVRLIEQKLEDFGVKACFEHHQSRQKGGKALLSLVDAAINAHTPISRDDVHSIVLTHCQVHLTTTQENSLLRKHQRKCSSEAAYRRATIELVEARDLFTKKGRHSAEWKQQMTIKYQPIVDEYNNPTIIRAVVPEPPVVIN